MNIVSIINCNKKNTTFPHYTQQIKMYTQNNNHNNIYFM